MNGNVRAHVLDLLESWPERKRNIVLLHYELDHAAQTSKNEMIEAMALSHGDDSGGSKGYISDKTLYIALNYQNKTDTMNAEAKEEIVVQLVELEQEQKRLEHYISLLDDRHAEVLQLTYEKKMPQSEAEKIMGLSAKTIRKLKNEALDALVEMYEFVACLP